MPPEILGEILPVPANCGQMANVQCEGKEMVTLPSRKLPLELLIAIADQLCNGRDIIAFGLTCIDLYTILLKKRRTSLEIRVETSRSYGTTITGPKYRLLSQQAAALTLTHHGRESCPVDNHQQRGPTSCNCWGPVKSLDAIHQLWETNQYRKLTLSGYVPGIEFRKSHPLIPPSAFMMVAPEIFKVETVRALWDVGILESMFLTNLKSLSVPISHPSDCVRLGLALAKMPRLVRLSLADIPNSRKFVNRLVHIGGGILNRASTLRELNIEMATFNCVPLTEPENGLFIFGNLFPCGLMQKLYKLRERSRIYTGSVVKAPLRLTKLQIKHLSLPSYSFGVIFDATTIKHIHLPNSKVDRKVWEVLERHAQLESLTEIHYDMFCAEFLGFLSRQTSLKELIFVRQEDWITYTMLSGVDIGMSYFTVRRGPSVEDFLSSLQHVKMLKHLVLPWDLYPITKHTLVFIATNLIVLEHLELGLNYYDHGVQDAFASHILSGMPFLKRITFLPCEQPQLMTKPHGTEFQTFVGSPGRNVSANLKLLRYMPQKTVFYHRETPLDGEWWMRVPADEGEQIFEEGRTPRIVPVGQWDWEIEAEQKRLETVDAK